MTQALEGVHVLDFSRHMAAPYGTVLLGDFGADVVKVESLPAGDGSRSIGTAFVGDQSGMFLQWNRNKRSLGLDLRHPDAQEIVRRLVEWADVLVESFRPGVADSIGIGYDATSAINPRLVYLSLTAFGPTGPLSQRPGTDPVVQAMSGVMHLTGERGRDSVLVGIPIADFTGAMAVTQGVLLGLLARERTGRGQRVDVPMLAALVFGLTTRLASYWADGEDPVRNGAAHSAVAPYETFRVSDGEIVAGAWGPQAWPRFCDAVGRPDLIEDPRFATNVDRMTNRAELNEILDKIFIEHSTAEWEARFDEANALFGEVCSISRALSHPQMEALGMVQSVEHATLGTIPQLAPPIFLSDTPGSIKRPPPVLGQHTSEVLAEIGYSAGEIDELSERGIVLLPDVGAAAKP